MATSARYSHPTAQPLSGQALKDKQAVANDSLIVPKLRHHSKRRASLTRITLAWPRLDKEMSARPLLQLQEPTACCHV